MYLKINFLKVKRKVSKKKFPGVSTSLGFELVLLHVFGTGHIASVLQGVFTKENKKKELKSTSFLQKMKKMKKFSEKKSRSFEKLLTKTLKVKTFEKLKKKL